MRKEPVDLFFFFFFGLKKVKKEADEFVPGLAGSEVRDDADWPVRCVSGFEERQLVTKIPICSSTLFLAWFPLCCSSSSFID
jgi:hypothetical protein